MRLSIPDAIKLAEADTEENAALVLKNNRTPALLTVLQYAFHPDAVFDVQLPEKFTLNIMPKGYADMSLFSEARRLYIFLKSYDRISGKKKTELLLTLLENLPSDEAILVRDIVTGVFRRESGLTPEIVEQAFPLLLTPPVVAEKPVVEAVTEPPKKKWTPKVKKTLVPHKPRMTQTIQS
jgi:hypothetical protein